MDLLDAAWIVPGALAGVVAVSASAVLARLRPGSRFPWLGTVWAVAVVFGAAAAGLDAAPVVVLFAVAVGWIVAATPLGRWLDPGAVAPWLLGASTVGLFVTLPDTEGAQLLGAATAFAAVGTWPVKAGRFGLVGIAAWAGLAAEVVTAGAGDVERAVASGRACVALTLAVCVAEAVAARRSRPRWRGVVLTIVHAPFVIVVARTAGLRDTPDEVWALAWPLIVALTVGWSALRLFVARFQPPTADR